MENRAHAIAAGLFLLVMGLALALVVAWFQGDRVQPIRHVVVSRTGVAGLNLKAPVKLRGVEVGKVEAIGFDPADPRQVLITIAVDPKAPITRGTVAKLALQGITGLSFVDLQDGDVPVIGADPLFAVRVSGFISLQAGRYSFLSFHDDGLRLIVGDDEVITFNADTPNVQTDSAFFDLGAAVYKYEAISWEQGVTDRHIGASP